MGDAVDAARKDETSIAQLTTALKANDKGWDGNSASIEKAISARMKLGFSDEEQRSSLGVLVAMVKDHSAALDINRTAMDLARLKGISLETASTVLGKAWNGNVTALQRMGIQLDKGTKGADALAAVQARVAGQAEAFGKSSEGAAVAAGVAFDELKEDIGRQLLPMMTALAHFAVDVLIPALESIVGVVSSIIGAIGGLVDGVGGAISDMAMNFGDMGDRLHKVADKSGKDFQVVKDTVKRYMDDLGLSFEDAASKAESDFSRMAHGVSPAMIALESMPAGTRQAMEGTVGAVTDGTGAIVEDMERLPGEMADAMLAEQQKLADSGAQLVAFMAAALSPAQETARAIGFLTSDGLAQGLASGNPLVRQKAEELQAANLAVLARTTGYAGAGGSIGLAWIGGITGAIRNGIYDMTLAVNAVRNRLGHSLPTEGPLAGSNAEKGGLAIGAAWAGGIGKGIDLNMPSLRLPGVGGAGAGGGSGLALAGAGGGGNLTVIFNSTWPPTPAQAREIAEEVSRQQYFMAPTVGILGKG